MAYLTSDLIASVRRRSFAPTGQNTFTTADILALADEEIATLLVPHIVSMREEYFQAYEDQPIVAGKSAYDIPARAIGMAVREVKLVDPNGSYYDIPQLTTETVPSDSSGTPRGFYLRENSIVLWPKPETASLTLRIWYLKTHNKLIDSSSAARIASVSGATATVSAVPAAFTSGDLYDVIKGTGGHEILAMDLAANAVTSGTIDFVDALASSIVAGCYIAKAGESPLISLPSEYRPILSQAVTVRILRSMRVDGADEEQAKLKEMLQKSELLVSPRVLGEKPKIISAWV